jgi:hypothetical protein
MPVKISAHTIRAGLILLILSYTFRHSDVQKKERADSLPDS